MKKDVLYVFLPLVIVSCGKRQPDSTEETLAGYTTQTFNDTLCVSNDSIFFELSIDVPCNDSLAEAIFRGKANDIIGYERYFIAKDSVICVSDLAKLYLNQLQEKYYDDDTTSITRYREQICYKMAESNYPGVLTYHRDYTYQYENLESNSEMHTTFLETCETYDVAKGKRLNLNDIVDKSWNDTIFGQVRTQLKDLRNYFSDATILQSFSILDGKFYFLYDTKDYFRLDVSLPMNERLLNDTLPNLDMRSKYYHMPQYINSVKGHVEKKQISGNFTGTGIDRLYIEEHSSYDWQNEEYHWVVRSSNPNIPELILRDNWTPSLTFEGDLDGNGIDEFGVLATWKSSACRCYYIYTLVDGKWYYLIKPMDTAHNIRCGGQELAIAGPTKGSIVIWKSDWDANLSCCAWCPIVCDTVQAEYILVE